MKRILLSLAVLAALAPSALSPAAASSVPPSLDVIDVAFASLYPRWHDRTDRQLEVIIRVVDLVGQAPVYDGQDTKTRHYYEVRFTHDATNTTYVARCYIHFVALPVENPIGAGNYGVSYGCQDIRGGARGGYILDVRMSAPLNSDEVRIIISSTYADGMPMPAGTLLRDISVMTAEGDVTTTAGWAHGTDPRGPTVDSYGPLSFTL